MDGQQRVTSLYRALNGIDKIFFVLKEPEDLPDLSAGGLDIMDVIEGFSFKKLENRVCFTVDEIFKMPGESPDVFWRKKIFDEEWGIFKENPVYSEYEEDYFLALLLIKYQFNRLLDDKTLLSVFLLDMDLEKFCLFFERSNSRGVTLSFTDIITAKVYVGFNLRKEKEKLEEIYSFPVDKNIVEAMIRYICYLETGKVDKKTILASLDHEHFTKHWEKVADLFEKVYKYIRSQKLVINFSWLKYKTMLIPMAHFLSKLVSEDFSQMNQSQLEYFKFWFYSSMMNTRYGGGMAGSTNVIVVEDCELLEGLAETDSLPQATIRKFKIELGKEELYALNSRGASFDGVMSLVNHHSHFRNWGNISYIDISDKIDVHHIFPKKYIEKKYGEESNENENVDTILNKVVIEKLPNQIYGSKAPSVYLNEEPLKKNKNIEVSLNSHFIPNHKKLIEGGYDGEYISFLEDRYDEIEKCINEEVINFQNRILLSKT